MKWRRKSHGGNVYVMGMYGCLWNTVPSVILMEAAGCTMQEKHLFVPHVGNLLVMAESTRAVKNSENKEKNNRVE